MLEKLLEDIMFEAGANEDRQYTIDEAYVLSKLDSLTVDKDLSKFIL